MSSTKVNYNNNTNSINNPNSYSLSNTNTGLKIIIVSAIGWTLGSSLKSITDSTVFDLIEPAVFQLIHMLKISKFESIGNLIPKEKRTYKIANFLSNLLSFIFIVYIVLIIYNYYN
jgi:large-conductance mechanosensitive channel